jgi:Na+/proline symporter
MNSDTLTGCFMWVIIIIVFAVMVFSFRGLYKTVESAHQMYKPHMGDLFVIDGDTLTIVDYSLFRESFILSNGTRVNYYLITETKNKESK